MKYSEFYLAFENKFRGTSENLNNKLGFYDGLLAEILCRFPSCRLLDIGSGRGEWLIKCQELGIQSLGVDNNMSMVRHCEERGLKIKYGDALESLKTFEDNSFELITSFHFIEHISFDLILELLEECKRLLVPGGVLILETPSIDNILVSSKNFYLDPTHITHIHPEVIKFALHYFKFNESNYFLLNSEKPSNNSSHELASFYGGAGQDVTIISRLNHPSAISLFDESLDWVRKINISKNTIEIISEYDQITQLTENRFNHELNLVNSQIDHLMYVYNRVFNSLPARLYRKFKSTFHFLRVNPIEIVNVNLPSILKIRLLKRIYSKLFNVLFSMQSKYFSKINRIPFTLKNTKKELDTKKNDLELIKLFNSNSRSSQIFSDIKVRLKRK